MGLLNNALLEIRKTPFKYFTYLHNREKRPSLTKKIVLVQFLVGIIKHMLHPNINLGGLNIHLAYSAIMIQY